MEIWKALNQSFSIIKLKYIATNEQLSARINQDLVVVHHNTIGFSLQSQHSNLYTTTTFSLFLQITIRRTYYNEFRPKGVEIAVVISYVI